MKVLSVHKDILTKLYIYPFPDKMKQYEKICWIASSLAIVLIEVLALIASLLHLFKYVSSNFGMSIYSFGQALCYGSTLHTFILAYIVRDDLIDIIDTIQKIYDGLYGIIILHL